ncbi:HD domain-containing protein [Patescibacteria group bacterium]
MTEKSIEKLFEKIIKYSNSKNLNIQKIEKAFNIADKYHKNQLRKSGDPFILHPLTVASYIVEHDADENSIIAALLHDTVEDTKYTLTQVKKDFGNEVAILIDGLTKFSKTRFRDAKTLDHKIESLRKMFVLMKRDIRIIVIKLFDRLHNLRTLDAIREDKRVRIAQETLDVYVVLARHLGLWSFKKEMEDICFYYLNPQEYKKIEKNIVSHERKHQQIYQRIKSKILAKKNKFNIKGIFTVNRSFFYIHQKVQAGKEFSQLTQEFIFNVIVENRNDCYNALALLHTLGKVQNNSIKDYIAVPLENKYRSLHTCVIDEHGRYLFFQIRTEKMNREANEGVLNYCFDEKEHDFNVVASWLINISALDKSTKEESNLFWDALRNDILKKRIFVFEEHGKIIRLPYSSTVLDFVFQTYPTEKARFVDKVTVNGRPKLLNHVLSGGEHIKASFDKSTKEDINWLSYVNSDYARSCIKKIFKKDKRENKIKIGGRILQEELNRYKLGFISEFSSRITKKLLTFFNESSFEEVLIRIAEGDINAEEIREHVVSNGKSPWKNKNYHQKIYIKIIRKSNPSILTNIFSTLKKIGIKFKHLSTKKIDGICIDKFQIKSDRINTFNSLISHLKVISGIHKIEQNFPSKRIKSYIFMFFVVIFWAINPIVIHYLGIEEVSAEAISGIRLVSTALFLLIINLYQILITKKVKTSFKMTPTFWIITLLIGLHIYFVHKTAILTRPINYMLMLEGSAIILGIIYGYKNYKNLSSFYKYLLLSLSGITGIGGILLLFLLIDPLTIDDFNLYRMGNIFGLFAMGTFIIYTLLTNRLFKKQRVSERETFIIGQFFLFAALIYAFFMPWKEILALSLFPLSLAILNGVTTSGLGHIFYFKASKYIEHAQITFITGIITIPTIIIESILFGLHIYSILSVILILIAILCVSILESKNYIEKEKIIVSTIQ